MPPAARCATSKAGCQCSLPTRSSGQITLALGFRFTRECFLRPVCQTFSFKSGKSITPGRPAGDIFHLATSGGKGGEATLGKKHLESNMQLWFSCFHHHSHPKHGSPVTRQHKRWHGFVRQRDSASPLFPISRG
jgi:hypothetical protein